MSNKITQALVYLRIRSYYCDNNNMHSQEEPYIKIEGMTKHAAQNVILLSL